MEGLRRYLNQEISPEKFPNGMALKMETANGFDSGSEESLYSSDELTCKKCTERIDERYFLVMDNKEWHFNCLVCDICRKNLGHQASCFLKNNVIFCRGCYTRAGLQTCEICDYAILRSEFVFKCNQFYFHYDCFFCNVCKRQLRKGQKFGKINNLLYCEEHFVAAKEDIENRETASDADSVFDFGYAQNSNQLRWDLHTRPMEMHIDHMNQDCFSYEMTQLDFMFSGTSFNKTEHFESMLPSPSMRVTVLDGKNTCKRKRTRTSFRHEQLQELRRVFVLNQNPDTAELLRMSQQIGLSKRVLQVWFQNARAKQRRSQRNESSPKTTINKDKER